MNNPIFTLENIHISLNLLNSHSISPSEKMEAQVEGTPCPAMDRKDTGTGVHGTIDSNFNYKST